MDKKSIDLSTKTFIDYENKKTTLWDIVNQGTAFEPALSIQDILNETPPSLTFSANKRKVYTKDNHLILTFDDNKSFTQLLNVNLSDFTVIQKSYPQPYIEISDFDDTDCNSFLLTDKIIQLRLNSRLMHISIKDLEGIELKDLEVDADR